MDYEKLGAEIKSQKIKSLLNEKDQIEHLIETLKLNLKKVNDKIGEAKYGIAVNSRFTVPLTNNTYVVSHFDDLDNSMYICKVSFKDGVEELSMAQEARFWFEYKNGTAKTPTRKF